MVVRSGPTTLKGAYWQRKQVGLADCGLKEQGLSREYIAGSCSRKQVWAATDRRKLEPFMLCPLGAHWKNCIKLLLKVYVHPKVSLVNVKIYETSHMHTCKQCSLYKSHTHTMNSQSLHQTLPSTYSSDDITMSVALIGRIQQHVVVFWHALVVPPLELKVYDLFPEPSFWFWFWL